MKLTTVGTLASGNYRVLLIAQFIPQAFKPYLMTFCFQCPARREGGLHSDLVAELPFESLTVGWMPQE